MASLQTESVEIQRDLGRINEAISGLPPSVRSQLNANLSPTLSPAERARIIVERLDRMILNAAGRPVSGQSAEVARDMGSFLTRQFALTQHGGSGTAGPHAAEHEGAQQQNQHPLAILIETREHFVTPSVGPERLPALVQNAPPCPVTPEEQERIINTPSPPQRIPRPAQAPVPTSSLGVPIATPTREEERVRVDWPAFSQYTQTHRPSYPEAENRHVTSDVGFDRDDLSLVSDVFIRRERESGRILITQQELYGAWNVGGRQGVLEFLEARLFSLEQELRSLKDARRPAPPPEPVGEDLVGPRTTPTISLNLPEILRAQGRVRELSQPYRQSHETYASTRALLGNTDFVTSYREASRIAHQISRTENPSDADVRYAQAQARSLALHLNELHLSGLQFENSPAFERYQTAIQFFSRGELQDGLTVLNRELPDLRSVLSPEIATSSARTTDRTGPATNRPQPIRFSSEVARPRNLSSAIDMYGPGALAYVVPRRILQPGEEESV